MTGIAFNSSGAAIFNGHEDRAGIGAIVRTGGVNNAHDKL
jgi:hypothetical protein